MHNYCLCDLPINNTSAYWTTSLSLETSRKGMSILYFKGPLYISRWNITTCNTSIKLSQQTKSWYRSYYKWYPCPKPVISSTSLSCKQFCWLLSELSFSTLVWSISRPLLSLEGIVSDRCQWNYVTTGDAANRALWPSWINDEEFVRRKQIKFTPMINRYVSV